MPLVTKPFGDIITFTRASTGTYFDAAGTLQSATTNTPRFDYNPATLAPLGLLIEEQRTNLILQSETFDNAGWSKIRSTITQNASIAPSGLTTADKFVEDTSVNDTHIMVQGASVTSGTAYAASFYLKASERSSIYVSLSVSFPGGADAIFNASTGIATNIGFTSCSMTPVGNGWFRCVAIATANATGTGNFNFYSYNGSTIVYTGDGTSGVFVWGAQLEAGAFPTSYIPTTTTALTRAADVASVNTLSPWFNPNEGTLFVESQRSATQTTAAFPRAVSANDGTTNNELGILWATASSKLYSVVVTAGAVQADLGYFGQSQTATHKAALAYRANDFAFSADAQAVQTDASGTIPAVSRLDIGSFGGSNNGYIRRITYYPRRLSNTELQALTT